MRKGLPMIASDNDRFNGWTRVHEFLGRDAEGRPWLTFEPTGCPYLLRTLPAQMQDKNDHDDMDTTGDDHGCDGVRYWAMKRPSPTRISTKPPPYPVGSWGWHTTVYHPEAQKGVLER
jgi:hypothetical protein